MFSYSNPLHGAICAAIMVVSSNAALISTANPAGGKEEPAAHLSGYLGYLSKFGKSYNVVSEVNMRAAIFSEKEKRI